MPNFGIGKQNAAFYFTHCLLLRVIAIFLVFATLAGETLFGYYAAGQLEY